MTSAEDCAREFFGCEVGRSSVSLGITTFHGTECPRWNSVTGEYGCVSLAALIRAREKAIWEEAAKVVESEFAKCVATRTRAPAGGVRYTNVTRAIENFGPMVASALRSRGAS